MTLTAYCLALTGVAMDIETKEIRAYSIIRKIVLVTGIVTFAPTGLLILVLLLHRLHLPTWWLTSSVTYVLWMIPPFIGINLLVPCVLFFWSALGLEDAWRKLLFGGRVFLLISPVPIVLVFLIFLPIPKGFVWLSPGLAGLILIAYWFWMYRRIGASD